MKISLKIAARIFSLMASIMRSLRGVTVSVMPKAFRLTLKWWILVIMYPLSRLTNQRNLACVKCIARHDIGISQKC